MGLDLRPYRLLDSHRRSPAGRTQAVGFGNVFIGFDCADIGGQVRAVDERRVDQTHIIAPISPIMVHSGVWLGPYEILGPSDAGGPASARDLCRGERRQGLAVAKEART